MLPSPPMVSHPSKARALVGTPASTVNESKSSLVVRPRRPCNRNIDGPLYGRFRLDGDSLSTGDKEIAANVRSHHVDTSTCPISAGNVDEPLLDTSMAPHRRLSQRTLPMKSARKQTTGIAIPSKRTEGLEAKGYSLVHLRCAKTFSAPGSAGLLFAVGYSYDDGPWAVADHHAALYDHITEPPISSYSALADALFIPECNNQVQPIHSIAPVHINHA
ncbi:hypothetical protein BD414DRAFT_488971 [Trametes punicea]|nr:hypothetical protein BD414DRAFT_488971 [Trametes punicea]